MRRAADADAALEEREIVDAGWCCALDVDVRGDGAARFVDSLYGHVCVLGTGSRSR